MNKLLAGTLAVGVIVTSIWAGVKEVYVGSRPNGVPYYVVNCTNGNHYHSIHQENDGYWHRGAGLSNMGDRYKGLSINEVADKLCN